jgi:hypothetical protein
MSASLFQFGEQVPGQPVPVLNERAVRADAGLLFLFAMIAFLNAWLTGNFEPTRIFVAAFLIDFALRLFVSPRYAPSLIVGQWMVRGQQPEWTGAPQKQFAWAIGLALALVMFWLVVIRQLVGPVALLVCAICLTLLFFETAFGICIGCKLYGWLRREAPQACPGDACTAVAPDPRSQPRWPRGLVVLAFLGGVAATAHTLEPSAASSRTTTAGQPSAAAADGKASERCRVPEFAKAIGHEEMWKRHNNCL